MPEAPNSACPLRSGIHAGYAFRFTSDRGRVITLLVVRRFPLRSGWRRACVPLDAKIGQTEVNTHEERKMQRTFYLVVLCVSLLTARGVASEPAEPSAVGPSKELLAEFVAATRQPENRDGTDEKINALWSQLCRQQISRLEWPGIRQKPELLPTVRW